MFFLTLLLILNIYQISESFNDEQQSHFNREMCFREAVDVKMQEIKDYVRTVVVTLEKEVKDCLLRRDKK